MTTHTWSNRRLDQLGYRIDRFGSRVLPYQFVLMIIIKKVLKVFHLNTLKDLYGRAYGISRDIWHFGEPFRVYLIL